MEDVQKVRYRIIIECDGRPGSSAVSLTDTLIALAEDKHWGNVTGELYVAETTWKKVV